MAATPKVPFLGCRMSLISRSEIRYEGTLYTVDVKESTLALAKVQSHGTEDRPTDKPVPPRPEIYEYIIFRAADIKDVRVCEAPKSGGGIENDPAIVKYWPFQHSNQEGASGLVPQPVPIGRLPTGNVPNAPFVPFHGVSAGPWATNGSASLFDVLGVRPGSPRGRSENRRPRYGMKSRSQPNYPSQVQDDHHIPMVSFSNQNKKQTSRNAHSQVPNEQRGGGRRRSNSQRSQGRSQDQHQQQPHSSRRSTTTTDYIDLDASSVEAQSPIQTTSQGGGRQQGGRRRGRNRTHSQSHPPQQQNQHHQQQHGGRSEEHHGETTSHSASGGHPQQHPGGGGGGMRGRGGRGRYPRGMMMMRGGRGRWGWNNWNYRGGWFMQRGNRGRRNSTRQAQQAEDQTKYETDFDFEGAEEEFQKLFLALKKATPVELSVELMKQREGQTSSSPPPSANGSKRFYEKSKFFDEISCEAQERAHGQAQERMDWRMERKLNSETFGEVLANRAGRGYFHGRGGGFYNYYPRRGGYMRRGSYRWSTGIPVPSNQARRRTSSVNDTAEAIQQLTTATSQLTVSPTPVVAKEKSTSTESSHINVVINGLSPLPQRGQNEGEGSNGVLTNGNKSTVAVEQ